MRFGIKPQRKLLLIVKSLNFVMNYLNTKLKNNPIALEHGGSKEITIILSKMQFPVNNGWD